MWRLFFIVLSVPLVGVFLYSAVWASLAMWFKLPGPDVLRFAVIACFVLVALRTLVAFAHPNRWRWLIAYGAVFAGVLVFWNSLVPPVETDLSPEVSRQVTGVVEGDILTLTNMRDFEWRSANDATENWITRSYDLSQIESTDLFMSYWGGPHMAHLILSFGFADGTHLAWSVEVRRSVGETFSPVADYFKANTVGIIAAEERDLVGLRANIQKARVHLFRLDVPPEGARAMIESLVDRANGLVEQPEFFHSVFTNCSMVVVKIAQSVGADVSPDWRVIVNGHLPAYVYERGVMPKGYSLDDLYALGDISERARSFGLKEGFAAAIREGVPEP